MKKIQKATWELKIFNPQVVAKAVAMTVWGIENYKDAPELLYDEQFECHPVVRETEKVIILKTVSDRIIQISKKRPIVRFIAPHGSICLFHQLNSILSGIPVFGKIVKKVEADVEVDVERLIKNIFSWGFGPYSVNHAQQKRLCEY